LVAHIISLSLFKKANGGAVSKKFHKTPYHTTHQKTVFDLNKNVIQHIVLHKYLKP